MGTVMFIYAKCKLSLGSLMSLDNERLLCDLILTFVRAAWSSCPTEVYDPAFGKALSCTFDLSRDTLLAASYGSCEAIDRTQQLNIFELGRAAKDEHVSSTHQSINTSLPVEVSDLLYPCNDCEAPQGTLLPQVSRRAQSAMCAVSCNFASRVAK